MTEVKLEPSWKKVIGGEFNKAYMQQLKAFLVAEKQAGKTIYPKGSEYFQAFSLTPFEEVKVVILGQDPYHGPGQAHGLCFSVRPKVKIPPSLINIYKELQADLGITPPQHGCLEGWAKQGVLLLNSVLTVEQGRAAAHQGRGWEQFTDHAISVLNQSREGVVFMLWGAYAQKKGSYIDTSKHLVLKSVHPSPLSAHRGFLGCKHFSQANHYLQQQGKTPIDWQLPIQMEQMAYAQA
ncbi:uracil-DNA glycosylase [Zooshikella ganghwensis]|uniref:uracil-DNA glycosylase n=1 Tax=Zooshikella ganghwensis TaxID=202772 RepID=UPI000401D8B5|nr:uracil-DNA glycosylase [Zooshikella ganghwensis]